MTIYDVARLAGVSQQTVSRVINGSDGVSAATRARVVDACTTLGFVPNRAARTLRSARHPDVGLVVVADAAGDWHVPAELGRRLRDGGGAVLVEWVDTTDGVAAAHRRLTACQVGEVVVVGAALPAVESRAS